MFDSIQALLDAFPEGAVRFRDGAVLSANAMARHYLPGLTEGAPCPEGIPLPRTGPSGAGVFTFGGTTFTCGCTRQGDEHLLLFRPAPQSALTGRQLEGVLTQLRGLLGEVLAEVGPATGQDGPPVPAAAFSKSFHRLFRLVGNLEYMREASGEEGVLFRPVTMDLEGLCRHTAQQAGPLLGEAGVSLYYETALTGLLIPGDPELLQHLLLELLVNAARAAEGGEVVLSLRRQGSRDVAALHGGSLVVEWGQSAPSAMVSLPTGPLSGQVSVRSPSLQRDGGLDPVLTQLSDLLPDRVFGLEGLD